MGPAFVEPMIRRTALFHAPPDSGFLGHVAPESNTNPRVIVDTKYSLIRAIGGLQDRCKRRTVCMLAPQKLPENLESPTSFANKWATIPQRCCGYVGCHTVNGLVPFIR